VAPFVETRLLVGNKTWKLSTKGNTTGDLRSPGRRRKRSGKKRGKKVMKGSFIGGKKENTDFEG